MKNIEAYSAKKNGHVMLNANELYKDVEVEVKKDIMSRLMEIEFNRYPEETNQEVIKAYSKVVHVPPENIIAGNGSDEMLGFMIHYFLGKGKNLYTLSPDFSMYDYYTSMQEANIIKYACEEDGSFDIYEFIEKGREQQVNMILFSNPNNPTGHFLRNGELMKIVEAFPSIPVIIDEAYSEFAKESMVDVLNRYPNLYVTRTLSKAYGLAGIRLGFLISNKANIENLRPNVVPYNISSINQKIGAVVLAHADKYQAIIEDIITQRDELYEQVKHLKNITFYPSKANYLYGRSPFKESFIALLEEQGIIIRTYANDTFRVTIGSKEENALVKKLIVAFDKEIDTI